MVAHGPFISMAAFCAWNRLSASAPVMFCGAMPFLRISCAHWVTAFTEAEEPSMPWLTEPFTMPPPFPQSRIGHIGIVLFSASAMPYCGDIEEARYSFPSLTTISPDKQQIARLAVARLIERLNGDAAQPAAHHVDYRLAIRESTGQRG